MDCDPILSTEYVDLPGFLGYYQVPEHSTIKLSPAVSHLQLTSGSSHHHRSSGSPAANQFRQGMRAGRQHRFGGHHHHIGPGGIPVFAPPEQGQPDENGVITNSYPDSGEGFYH